MYRRGGCHPGVLKAWTGDGSGEEKLHPGGSRLPCEPASWLLATNWWSSLGCRTYPRGPQMPCPLVTGGDLKDAKGRGPQGTTWQARYWQGPGMPTAGKAVCLVLMTVFGSDKSRGHLWCFECQFLLGKMRLLTPTLHTVERIY